MDGSCMVKDNVIKSNLQNNLYVDYYDNVVENNLVVLCTAGNGIKFSFSGNFYANNRASGNNTNYANVATQTDGGGNVSF